MKNKLFILILCVTVLLIPVSLFAKDRITDEANLLSSENKARLERLIDEIYSTYNFELLIVTKDSIGRANSIKYSWDLLDSMGLDGYEWDGCLFLRSMEYRDYVFTASGRGDKILNKTAYDRLENDVTKFFDTDNYVRAFETYIEIWDEYLALAAKGRSYNFFTHNNLILVIASWIVSLIIGLVVVTAWKAQLNTALPKLQADTYTVPDSMVITKQSDSFLYSTTIRTQKASSSSSSSGGRSSSSGGGRSSRSGRR